MFTASVGAFVIGLILAFAGGAFGAAIGGNYAFVLTGFSVLASWGMLAATGSSFGLDYIAFGPFMGPHIAFAGGAAAAIYARYKGYMADGKDVNSPLAGLGRADVYYVGSLFGVGAFLLQHGIAKLPWFGAHTDSIALTVLTSGIVARLMFGGEPGSGIFRGSLSNLKGRKGGLGQKIAPSTEEPNNMWLGWQSKAAPLTAIGSMFGIAAGGISLVLAAAVSTHLTAAGFDGSVAIGAANSFVFGISAVIILFLITDRNMPVQHHVTNIAGLAAIQFFILFDGKFDVSAGFADWFAANTSAILIALVAALVFGLIEAFGGEFFARLWYNRGTSHIDPPAAAIWWGNTLVWICVALLS